MMNYCIRAIRFEFARIFSSKAWWIVFGIVAVIQPLLALVEAITLGQIGITATPETHPQLAVALPPLDYFGFDVILFGQAAIVILGGITGASVFRNHELRTTFLCLNKRAITFLVKLLAIFAGSIVVSFVSVYVTIAVTHIGLGNQGLHPLILSPVAWKFIAYGTLDWVLLSVLSFGLGILSRNAIVPLLLMVPQVVGLGGWLAQKWEWAGYLPVAVGNLLFALPTDTIPHDPVKGGLILAIWAAATSLLATYLFVRRDIGGNH